MTSIQPTFYFVLGSGLPDTLAIAFALSALTYFLAPLMRTIPKDEIAAWSVLLRNDSLISMIAIGTVSVVQSLLGFVSELVTSNLTGTLASDPTTSYLAIVSQLGLIDGGLVLITSAVSAIPKIAGLGLLLGNMLGSLAMFVTNSIVLWSIIQAVSTVLQNLFLLFYGMGILFWSMPFRIGRALGAHIIATTLVLSVGLPLAAPAALWVEEQLALAAVQSEFQSFTDKLKSNPLLMLTAVDSLVSLVGKLLAAVFISLLIFPIVYLTGLGFIIRGLAMALGGYSPGLMLMPR